MKGRQLGGRYELIDEIGAGGMGVVWRGRDLRLGRPVAVKLLPAAALGDDVARGRLLREAHAAAALDHPGIVRVYDVGETDDGGAFLVMELVKGRSLRSALEAGAPDGQDERVQVILEAAQALQFAHDAGFVHRDVKPDNIMLRDNGRVTVVDFGIAKTVWTPLLGDAATLPDTRTRITADGQLVGTPAYLAPEQARGDQVSPATDQFALAVTSYEVLTGRYPWQGESTIEVVASMLRDAPRPLADLPGMLDDVFARALAKAPADRYRTILAFAEALREAARTEAASTAPRPVTPPAATTQTMRTVSTDEGPVQPRAALGPRVAAAVVVVGVVAAVIALATSWRARAVAPPAAVAPASTAIACPPFRGEGEDAPWLGVAVACLACEQVQLGAGGADARTLTTGDLLGAARDFTQESAARLEGPQAREQAIAAASSRGVRWLDGHVEHGASGYIVTIALRSPDGHALQQGEGRGVEAYEALRGALRPVIPQLGASSAEMTEMRTWLDIGTPEEGATLLGVRYGILTEDLVSLKAACEEAERLPGLPPRVRYLTRAACARKLRTPSPGAPPDLDESTPGALITTALAQGATGGADATRARAGKLEEAARAARSPENQARLLAAAAEVLNLIGDKRVGALARQAAVASPKAVDWRTSTWHRLAFSSDGERALVDGLVVWQPWEPVSQLVRHNVVAFATPDGGSTSAARRGYLLAQRGFFASDYALQLIVAGQLEPARSVAEAMDDDTLRVEVMVAEGRYAAVYDAMPALLSKVPSTDERASQAFRLANAGALVAFTLERPAGFVDDIVTRFVDASPHHVIDGVVPFTALVSACCLAPHPTGRRCIDRLQKLRATGELATIIHGSESILAGAARYVAGDFAGAAAHWRTMLRTASWIQETMADIMAITFDRAGMTELGAEIDAAALGNLDAPRAARLAWVRAARRAYARGDVPAARRLAETSVAKWRFADADIPARREMQDLLAKLPR